MLSGSFSVNSCAMMAAKLFEQRRGTRNRRAPGRNFARPLETLKTEIFNLIKQRLDAPMSH
jgi:hypothetical protein